MQTKHYHVLIGLRGLYMPNNNDVCKTKEEATECAEWWAEHFADDPETKVEKTCDDFWEVGEHECIEITECNESDCLEHMED
jgi:hypothetical protein